MKSLVVTFLEQAFALEDTDIDLAIACICNARCCRNIALHNRAELDRILCDMQTIQRKQWRNGRP